MEVLELPIPPLPQWITVGHGKWKPGSIHFRRSFSVYDMLFVKHGTMFMTEDERPYEISSDHMLVLEPDRTHWGHMPCAEETEIYWVHFIHDAPRRTVASGDIPWTNVLRKGTDGDVQPSEQTMYIPKFAQIDLQQLCPVLDRMTELHHRFSVDNALELHSLLGQLFVLLQSFARARYSSRSLSLCESVIEDIHAHMLVPFQAEAMERRLHFHFDYLSRCLKKHTGMTPLQYLHHIQIGKAKSLLEHTDDPVHEIGAQVGIPNTNYSIRLFKRLTGVAPGHFRRRLQQP